MMKTIGWNYLALLLAPAARNGEHPYWTLAWNLKIKLVYATKILERGFAQLIPAYDI